MKLTDRDKGYKALLARVLKSKNLSLTIGVHGPEGDTPAIEHDGSSHGATVADIATIHEYGLGFNPARSFIRGWADENEAQNKEAIRKIGLAVIKGTYTAEVGLERAGSYFVAAVQLRMTTGIPPGLAASTLRQRAHGGSVPLIDTGQLKSSIRYVVKVT